MHFNRAILKENAKIPLRQSYWMAFAVSLVVALLTGNVVNSFFNISFNFNIGDIMMYKNEFFHEFYHHIPWPFRVSFIWFTVVLGIIISFLGIAYKIFVGNILELSEAHFYLENRKYPAPFTEVFNGFKENYLNKVGVMFMRNLFISLWTLLFIVPGVIASYKYWAVKYILNENPNLSWQHALDMSKRMTYGRKMDLFMLNLSFIGWRILGTLLFGIGNFFVNPYYAQTETEAYEFIKQDALQNNRISYNEFSDMN